MTLPMPIRVLQAHPMVKENAGQVCYTRGPLVFCAEEIDNGEQLHLLRAKPEQSAEVTEMEIGGVSLPAIQVPAERILPYAPSLYQEWQPRNVGPVTLKLIPYFAWNYRGRGEMRVWLNT